MPTAATASCLPYISLPPSFHKASPQHCTFSFFGEGLLCCTTVRPTILLCTLTLLRTLSLVSCVQWASRGKNCINQKCIDLQKPFNVISLNTKRQPIFTPASELWLPSGCCSVWCTGDTETDSPAEAAEEGSGGAAGRRGERSHLVVWQVSLPTAPPRPHHLL